MTGYYTVNDGFAANDALFISYTTCCSVIIIVCIPILELLRGIASTHALVCCNEFVAIQQQKRNKGFKIFCKN